MNDEAAKQPWNKTGPHAAQPVYAYGEPIEQAEAVILMLHGRGTTAESILALAGDLAIRGFAYLAPQAAGNVWYPYPFFAPTQQNEPYLSSALSLLDNIVSQIVASGVQTERIILLGFSQGACLCLEYAACHAQRFGGLVGLSGALIGPDGTQHDYSGSFSGTPVFLGCSDTAFHMPAARVEEAAQVLQDLRGDVTMRLYPRLGHTVNNNEIEFVRAMMERVIEITC